MVSEDTQSIRTASDAARKAEAQKDIPSELTLSNGIKLKFKAIPPMLLNSVGNSVAMPPVPKVWLEDKQREEENPNHPAYLQALNDRTSLIAKATMDLILYACVEVIDVPEGLLKQEDTEWHIMADMAKLEFDRNDPIQTKLAWFRAYAIGNMDDMNKVQTVPMMLAGLMEGEVAEAMEGFRSGEERGTDSELPDTEQSSNGNHI